MRAGDAIGPYRLVGRLGRGAMGEVWQARDERLDRDVAVKLLPPDLAGDPERRARMLREARAAAAIPHANVVTLYDIVSAGDQDVLVMELVAGHNVADRLRDGGAPALDVGIGWLIAIADALAAAHARGVLHRDIKAANVMVTPAGVVKVLDFGLAKLAGDASPSPDPSPDPNPNPSPSPSPDPFPSPSPDPISTTAALDATLPSEPGRATARGDTYATRAGSLLGTPMYMAPEQIAGDPPDARTEVFSVGVLAFEILAGHPPFSARTVDELFVEIAGRDAPRLAEPIPPRLADAVARALARDRDARFPTMAAFAAALRALERDRLHPRARWPRVAVAIALVLGLGAGAGWWSQRPRPARKGDALVARALDEYDVFYTDKALSTLRTARRVDPTHPRALAYLVLFGGASDDDRAAAVAQARTVRARAHGLDRDLLDAALALEERGPAAARAVLGSGRRDPERSFWAGELAFRAGQYDVALDAYRHVYRRHERRFRGRLYDHFSAVLLWADEVDTAREVGARYHADFPGEADAAGVYATTLAAAGDRDRALALAEESAALNRSEDTVAGLAKVRALRGELALARDLYAQSLALAPPGRRALRRAALAIVTWMAGDVAGARAAAAPCLPGGAEADAVQRGACLWAAAIIGDPARPDLAATVIAELDRLAAAATPLRPAYGDPTTLAALVRAHATFAGGGCLVPAAPAAPADDLLPALERDLAVPLDFYAAYHVPFFATWALCERAALARAQGQPDRAEQLLQPARARAPGRWWLTGPRPP